VVGLVAITPAAGYVTIGASLFIGTVAALVCNGVVHWRSRSTLDDTLDVFPCHGVGGAVGMVATGVFAREVGLLTGQMQTFLMHLTAVIVVPAFTFGGSWLLYKLTDVVVPLRVDVEQEAIGLDLSQHGETTGDLSSLYRPPDARIA
jgi:Amt family ammonium transporter